MKRLISIALCACMIVCCSCVQVGADEQAQVSTIQSKTYKQNLVYDFTKTPQELVNDLGAGWNLGNTFEAWDKSWSVGNVSPTKQETAWYPQPVTTHEMIDLVAFSGFKSMRLPVTWYNQMLKQSDGSYKISDAFVKRIKEVVSYAYDNNLYVVLNMHHDDQIWLTVEGTQSKFDETKAMYGAFWKAIATAFKDYDEHLILEGMNEMTVSCNFDGCSTSSAKCWWGHDKNGVVFDRMNELYQVFVDTVRSTGGYNNKRYLMIPTYGAQWYANQIDNIKIPNNDSHMLIDIHRYTTSANVGDYTWAFDAIRSYCQNNNCAAVYGELGMNKNNQESVAMNTNWATAYLGTAKEYGVACFTWDDGGDMRSMERTKLTWVSNNYIKKFVHYSGECTYGEYQVTKPANCKFTGTEMAYCTVCHVSTTTRKIPIDPNAHEFGAWTVVNEPTCVSEGSRYHECALCGEIVSDTIDVDPNSHTAVVDKAVKATCTKTGLTQGSHCKDCGKTIVAQTATPKVAHSYSWVTTKKATYFATGSKAYKCSKCGKTYKTSTLSKLKLKTPSIKLSTKSRKITVKYAKVSGAKKYQVYIKIGNKWYKYTTSKTYYTKSKLKKGTRYYVKVRALTTYGSKTAYSSYSKTKYIKAK